MKETKRTCCRPLFVFSVLVFLFFVCHISFPTCRMPVSTSSSLCCHCPCKSSYLFLVVLSVQKVSVSVEHAWCFSGNSSLFFPFRSSCITFVRRVFFVCFYSFCSF